MPDSYLCTAQGPRRAERRHKLDFIVSALVRYAIFQIPGVRLVTSLIWLTAGLAVLSYVLLGAGLYAMARRQKLRGAFLAWVPVGQGYMLGALADVAAGGALYRTTLTVFSAATAASWLAVILSPPPLIAALGWTAAGLLIVSAVFWYKALYWVFAQYTKVPVVFLVLSIIFFFIGPIVVFIRRNASPKPITARERMNKGKEKRPGGR